MNFFFRKFFLRGKKIFFIQFFFSTSSILFVSKNAILSTLCGLWAALGSPEAVAVGYFLQKYVVFLQIRFFPISDSGGGGYPLLRWAQAH